jgi:hypothetical protein
MTKSLISENISVIKFDDVVRQYVVDFQYPENSFHKNYLKHEANIIYSSIMCC